MELEPTGYTGIAFSGPNPYGAMLTLLMRKMVKKQRAGSKCSHADIKLPFHLDFRTTVGYNYYLETQDYFQNAYNFGPVALSTNSLACKYSIPAKHTVVNQLCIKL